MLNVKKGYEDKGYDIRVYNLYSNDIERILKLMLYHIHIEYISILNTLFRF